MMLKLSFLSHLLLTMFDLWLDVLRFVNAGLRVRFALAAENLFLRKQCDLARGANRSGTPTQVGDSGFTSDDPTLSAPSSSKSTTGALVAALDDVCP